MATLYWSGADYHVPLLKAIASLPGGRGTGAIICERFLEQNHDCIPPEHRETRLSDNRQQPWEVRFWGSVAELTRRGLVQKVSGHEWEITDVGREWLDRNPKSTLLTGLYGKPPASQPDSSNRSVIKTSPPISLEQLEIARRSMQPEEFRHAFGELYDRLIAEDRARAVTPLSTQELLTNVEGLVKRVRDFLAGHTASVPRSEELCDWLHFCYAIGLYREAAALWQYVNEHDVHPWQYARTKRLAAACRARGT